jgi:hypothetical protein
LSIGIWEGRKNDRKSAQKIEAEASAKIGTSSASKHLASGCPEHDALRKFTALQRAWWSKVTVPWFDGKGGLRAVNPAGVYDLQVELGDREREFDGYVDSFIRAYPGLLTNAQFNLGDLFDPGEFPSPHKIKRKFYWTTDFTTLPRNDDIRLVEGLTPEQAKKMSDNAVIREQQRMQNAANVAAQRLFEVVQSMHATMATKIGEKGAKFNDTKLDNITAMVELMPLLNITNDPKLAEMAKLAKKLAMKSPDELRTDEVKRAAAAKEAKSLADKLAGAFDVTTEEDE